PAGSGGEVGGSVTRSRDLAELRARREGRSEFDRFDHACFVRETLPGDVEGRAVVHGRADEGQPEVYADALFKAVDLDRDVALVVVHDNDDVVPARERLVEDGVCRVRAGRIDAPGAGVRDSRGDLVEFFAP